MGLSGSRINEENHIVNGSRIACLIHDSIGAILSVPFCPLPFCPRTLRSAPDTARRQCRSFTPKHHRQLEVMDLPKVHTWQLEQDSNPRSSNRKVSTLPMFHHVPRCMCDYLSKFFEGVLYKFLKFLN